MLQTVVKLAKLRRYHIIKRWLMAVGKTRSSTTTIQRWLFKIGIYWSTQPCFIVNVMWLNRRTIQGVWVLGEILELLCISLDSRSSRTLSTVCGLSICVPCTMQLELQLGTFDFNDWFEEDESIGKAEIMLLYQAARKVPSNYWCFWPGYDRAMMHSKLNPIKND